MTRGVEFRPSAVRDFLRLPPDLQLRFRDALERLAENPSRARPGLDIRRLKGGSDVVWRLRVGEYRAIYRFTATTVVILEMGPRGNFY